MRRWLSPTSIPGLVAILGAARPCADEPPGAEWPDTPAGRWLRDYVAAVNSADDEAMRQFVLDHYSDRYLAETPLDQELARQLLDKRDIAPIVVHSVTSAGDYSATLIARNEKFGAFFAYTVELDPEPPHDAARLRGEPTGTPGGELGIEIAEWSTVQELVSQVREASGAPALAVAVVRGGEVVERAIAGSRRVDVDEPAALDDRFHLGSIGKSFTATMIAGLVERGKLGWDVTIGEVLADLPVREESRRVTLEQLLQHRGGIPSMATRGEFAAAPEALPARLPHEGRLALTRQVLQERPLAAPGTATHYSNAGYVVAGTLVERLLDTSWDELVTSLVFEPFGLESARFGWPATADAPHQPWGHIGAPPGLRPHQPGTFWNFDFTSYLAPAGDISAHVTDLAEYAAAHLRGLRGADGALSSASIRRLHTPPELDAEGNGYASGWVIGRTADGRPEHWHDGSAGSFFAVVSIYPDDDLAITVLTNYGLPAETSVFQLMEEILCGRLSDPPQRPEHPAR